MNAYELLGQRADSELLARLPEDSSKIEPWLRAGRRPMFVDRTGAQLARELQDFAQRSRAVIGVVSATRQIPQPHEGPDYEVDVLFRADGAPARYRFRGGWDSYHWAVSSPDHHGWFQAVMRKAGETLTVLYDPADGTAAPFGMLEPFVALTLAELLTQAREDVVDRVHWLNSAVDLVSAMRGRSAGRYRQLVGPVMSPLVGPSDEQWPRELARRVRLNEDPWSPLQALAEALPDERFPVWATR